jgi:hypothetical protein
MPSPFPGMDPYLEAPAGWQEFHSRFINTISDFLVPQLRPRYAVHIERYVYLTALDAEVTRLRPDISVAQPLLEAPRTEGAVATLTEIDTAILVPLPDIEEVRHYFLEIRELTTQRVVTVIEMLSPFNKRIGDGRTEYLKRRNAILNSDAHLIELDLLREGERVPMGKPLPPADYYAIVSRSYRRPMAEVYAWTIRQKMPTIPVPLLWGEPDVPLDLQGVLTTVYDRAGYDYRLPYERDPEPPLRAEDAAWGREIIAKWRKSST